LWGEKETYSKGKVCFSVKDRKATEKENPNKGRGKREIFSRAPEGGSASWEKRDQGKGGF